MICGPSAVSSNPKAERFLRVSEAAASVHPSQPDPPTRRSPAKARLAPRSNTTPSAAPPRPCLRNPPHHRSPPKQARPGLVAAATHRHPPPIQRPSQRRPGHATAPPLSQTQPRCPSVQPSQVPTRAPLPTRPHLSPSRPPNHPCPSVKSVAQNPHPTLPFSQPSTWPKGTTYTSLGHRPRKSPTKTPSPERAP